MSDMQKPYVAKVIVHMGVGEAGERLVNAENIMSDLTQGSKPIRSYAKNTLPALVFAVASRLAAKLPFAARRQ